MLCCRAAMTLLTRQLVNGLSNKGVKPNALLQNDNNFVNSSACQRPIALKELS